ncbi:MAG TPA: amidase family protein [Steroidobacteraceae bacterium]|nr:amidase family protein [Steroidobacteraceae bacterium]
MPILAASELCFKSAEELAGLIRERRLSPVELMEATLARIDAVNPSLNAFIQLDAERAMDEARAQTERLARGEALGPLGGLPFGVKELENATGFRSTSGSRAFEDRQAQSDDVHVARLKAAGGICLGKTNSPEFGYTAYTSNEVFGTTRNPWNLEHTPGGSSGGSAAAIAAGLAPLATASDGGGSIRIPACFVGAYGLKPTFGLVPVTPGEMLPWTDTSCYGPLTRTVRDAALYLDQVAGYDAADPTSYPRPPYSYRQRLEEPLPRLRIAFNRMLGCPHVQSDVLREVERAAGVFQELGHEVEDNVDEIETMAQHWIALGRFQSLAQMEDLILNHRDRFSPGYAAGFAHVEQIGAHAFGEAYRARAGLNRWLGQFFERYDLLLTPTMPLEAFAAEGPIPAEVEGVALGGGVIAFTAPFNFSGHPAATVRAGFTDAGLPAGLQIVGRRHADELVLRASYAYEQARPWNGAWPRLAADD